MTVVLTIWLLAAFYTAVWSAYRVWQRRTEIEHHRRARRSSSQGFSNTVSDVNLPAALKAQRSPDRALAPEFRPSVTPSELPPELEVTLATSLPLSEVVNPAETTMPSVAMNNLVAGEPAASEEPSHSPQDVLAEIAQLDQAESMESLDQLTQYLDHPDSVMRSALASVLGELAIKRQGQHLDQIITMLNTLATDTNLQVKTKAMAALGRIGTELDIV
ncbi:hypothetical protein ACN4EK_01310 [Pantanalinema rosaneae CENA516]|uniref:hypothetical protein n=1 Tax=Pantanalinema rosaneae TaxID=1620701 RepID=UPI003D6ECDD2